MQSQLKIGRYVAEFGAAMTGYVATIMLVVSARPFGGFKGDAKLFELLPILPLLFAFWAIIRQYRRSDEFFKRIHAEAFALGAMVWGLAIMIWGFAENAGAAQLQTIFIAPGLLACWGLFLPLIVLRYR